MYLALGSSAPTWLLGLLFLAPPWNKTDSAGAPGLWPQGRWVFILHVSLGKSDTFSATVQVDRPLRTCPRGPLSCMLLIALLRGQVQDWVLLSVLTDADLQIGKLMWGDSGLYYCIITTPDDLEGKNEDSVELLVLGE